MSDVCTSEVVDQYELALADLRSQLSTEREVREAADDAINEAANSCIHLRTRAETAERLLAEADGLLARSFGYVSAGQPTRARDLLAAQIRTFFSPSGPE